MKYVLIVIALLGALAFPAGAALETGVVTYDADGVTLEGYLAYEAAADDRRPGVLVVHEWWGLNDYARRRARMLAELGYVALAVDMYGGGRTAEHPDEAGRFAARLREDLPLAKKRFKAALEFIRHRSQVAPEDIAAIGYCFGGGMVLEMARTGVDLEGVVSFHGSLPTTNPPRPGKVAARVLVLHGGSDPLVPAEQVTEFRRQMKAARADFRIITYPGARHSFTNPEADAIAERFDLPLAYDSEADRKSWQAMRDFLNDLFAVP